jgi:uncharacterized protein (TIGR03086 family)
LYLLVDIIELLDTGYDWAGRRIAEVTPPNLAAPTPCEKWNLGQLLNHQIGVVHMMADRITTSPSSTASGPGPVGQQLADTDIIGADPTAAYAAAVEKIRAVWRTPGLLERMCVLPLGEVPVRMAATVALTDVVVHGWDVATALGRPAEIPPALAESILELVRPIAESTRGRAFGPQITDLPPGATASDRLVAFLGRKP